MSVVNIFNRCGQPVVVSQIRSDGSSPTSSETTVSNGISQEIVMLGSAPYTLRVRVLSVGVDPSSTYSVNAGRVMILSNGPNDSNPSSLTAFTCSRGRYSATPLSYITNTSDYQIIGVNTPDVYPGSSCTNNPNIDDINDNYTPSDDGLSTWAIVLIVLGIILLLILIVGLVVGLGTFLYKRRDVPERTTIAVPTASIVASGPSTGVRGVSSAIS